MRIAIDVMGGDFAPRELVLGALKHLESNSTELLLVGDETAIRSVSSDIPAGCEIIHTAEVVGMGEPPTQTLRKRKNASVALAARLVKQGKADAFLSAGSTGAQMAASLLEIGRIPGIERPAVAVLLPTTSERGVMILDVGANVDCRPAHLVQFALMGSAYYEKICGIDNPHVGILNIGAEPSKGNDLTKAVYDMLAKSGLNFAGNIEADQMYTGCVHVAVCDGFVGNVLLKASEGVAELYGSAIQQVIQNVNIPGEIAKTIFSGVKRFRPDAPEYSAAPLLGIAGVSVVCHGKSKSGTIANAIDLAIKYAESKVVKMIREHDGIMRPDIKASSEV